MKIFRAKQTFSNCGGFIYQGQLFLLPDATKLPLPTGGGDIPKLINEHYEEVRPASMFVNLNKFIKMEQPL
jgi:hypothetical protein